MVTQTTRHELDQDVDRARGRYERKVNLKFQEAERLAALSADSRDTYLRLSILRRRLAFDAKIPAYQILSNEVLLGLCERRPRQVAELLTVPGFGQVRVKAYGAEVLSVLRSGEVGQGPLLLTAVPSQ